MIRNYKKQIQNIQWLIYSKDELTELEKSSIQRVMDYIQSKVKLAYYENKYKSDVNYTKLLCLLDEKQQRIYTMHEMFENKKMNFNIEQILLADLASLKDMKYTLRYLLFGNLCSELKGKCNIDDLITSCKGVLGNNYTGIDFLYKIVNNSELFNSLQAYGQNDKTYRQLIDHITLTQDTIASLKVKIDYYDYLVDLQKELDNLSQMQLSFYLSQANDLSEKISIIEKDIERLSSNNELYLNSPFISRLLDYKKYRSNKRELQKSLTLLEKYKSQHNINQESMARCVECLRYELIHKINDILPEVHFPKDHYVKIIFDCTCKDKIVDNNELFMTNGFDLDSLVREYGFQNRYLQDLQSQMCKVKAEQKELSQLFDDQIDDETLIRYYDILFANSKEPSESGIRPYIAFLILSLIQETDKISKDMLVELLDIEDIEYLNQTYKTEIAYYLQNEINNMYELSLDTLMDKHNESNKLNIVKLKI